MKLVELVNSQNEFKDLLKMELPANVSLNLVRISRRFVEELKNWEEVRIKKVKEYGVPEIKDEKETGNFIVPTEKLPEFQADLETVLNSEVPIIIEKVKIEDLKGFSIKPQTLIKLSWLIVTE